MPKRLINLQPHFLTQPQEVPSMAPSPKSLTCTDGSPTAWKVIVLANLVFTTTSVAQYQKVSCGILGYLANLEPSFSQLILKMCRATHQIRTHRPGLARSQQGQSTRPFRSSRKRLQHRIQADGVHKTKNLNYSKISATFSLVTCVCVRTPNYIHGMPGCPFHWFGFNRLCSHRCWMLHSHHARLNPPIISISTLVEWRIMQSGTASNEATWLYRIRSLINSAYLWFRNGNRLSQEPPLSPFFCFFHFEFPGWVYVHGTIHSLSRTMVLRSTFRQEVDETC